MRELDVLLCRFFDRDYDGLGTEEKRAFEQLLDLPDPELFRYVLGRERLQDAAQADLLDRMLSPPA